MRALRRPAAALILLAATLAQAGGPLSICNDAGRTPIAYSPPTVNLNYDLGTLGGRSKAQADAIVTSAVALWTDVTTATITLGRGADLPVDVTTANINTYLNNFTDGRNPVIYDTNGSITDLLFGTGAKSQVLGFAGSAFFTAPTCRYAEGQAVINGFIAITDTSMRVVLAHEIGHLIGLDHSQLDATQGLGSSNFPLMYPIAFRSTATLHADDVASVSGLYPDATLGATYGEVTGNFVLANGVTPVLGANLWATETTTGEVYSVVSDFRTQNTGFFRLLLPDGNYTLRAEAISNSFTGGSSVGPYSEDLTQPSFQSPLYVGGVPMAILTLGNGTPMVLPVNAGCAASVLFRFDGTGTVGGNCVGAVSVSMATAAQSVLEDAGSVDVIVNRNGLPTGAASVNYATANGSAVAGTNYTATSGTLNWADGDSTPKTITVPITDDGDVNSARLFTVNLSGAVGITLGAMQSTTVTIDEDDTSLQFDSATASVSEGAASVSLTVWRAGNTTAAASVDWATVDGTALAGSDFGALGNTTPVTGTLNWGAGEGGSKNLLVPILNDALLEAAETFTVVLSNAIGTGASVGPVPETTVTIVDDEAALNFSSPTFSVNESGPNVSVTVNRTGATTNAIAVTWTTANGTAVAGQDYGTSGIGTQRTGTLSWAAGDSAPKSFTMGTSGTLPILNDTLVEGDEAFTITLSNPTNGAVLGATSVATVTIVDNESTVGFAPATLAVSEAGPNGTLSVSRTGSTLTSATVRWTTSNATALAGSDFGTAGSTTQRTGTLSWAAGDGAPKTIAVGPTAAAGAYIPVLNDTLIEGPETFIVTLSTPTGGAVIDTGANAATVTIVSDDGGVTMTSSTLSVAESAGTAEVMVSRSGSSSGAVSVNYATSNLTALAGTHYTATSGTLNWPDGDAAPKAISVPIIDNAAVNAARTFRVTISGPSGAALGSPSLTTVTIADDDNTLQFSAATASVSEAAGTLTLTVTRLGGAAGAASVNWSTADGTALAGADFGALGNTAPVAGTLNWAAGDATSKSVVIPILNDAIVEATKTFTVNLSGPAGTGASLGAVAAVTVTLLDDEAALNFSAPTFNVNEAGPNISVTVTRSGAATGAVAVTWTTSDGTAVAGQDFGISGNTTQRTGTLSWASGDSAPKSFTVGTSGTLRILNDVVVEGTEAFTITLSNPTNGAVLGPTSVATVTITDNDSTVAFAPTTLSVSEAGPNGTLTVTRTGATATSATVRWTTSNGTALVGSDFGTTGSTVQPTGTLSWAAGDATPKSIVVGPTTTTGAYIRVINDTTIEGPETFTVTLSAPTGGMVLGAGATAATVTIVSDDRGVTMASATQSVAESAGSVAVSVNRAGASTGAVSVNYATANGTALAGTHYTATSGTLNWPDGDTAPKVINVPVADNGAVNTARTFTVALSGAVGATLGTPASTTVSITDDDNTLQFSAATASVSEGTPTLTLSVTRLGGTAGAASVDWATADGSALAGSDFGTLGNTLPLTGTLNWAAGEGTTKTIVVPIIDDLVVEGAKTFTVNLSNPTGSGTGIGTNATITVTINDNDAGVVLSAAEYFVNETTSSLTITANRIGPATLAASVTWSTANGTAVAGQDFGTAGSAAQRTGTLSWVAGSATPRTFSIPILNDTASEGSEAFTVTLSNPSTGIVVGTPGSASVTILDDETPPESTIQFSQAKTVVSETMGSIDLIVTRTGSGYTFPGSVNYATAAGTALATSDYTTRTGTLTWAAGDSTSRTITVPITGNAVAEPPEQFTVVLSAPTPGIAVGTPSTATVLILDDDELFPPMGNFPAGWTIPGTADAGWLVSNDPGPFEGALALRTETIYDDETSQVQVAGNWLAGTVSFRVKISSEPTFDVLRFLIDGVEAARWSGIANTSWQLFSVAVPAGAHTFRWSYEKDGSGSFGQDAAWLDAVTLPTAAP